MCSVDTPAKCPRRTLTLESESTQTTSAGLDWMFSWTYLSEFFTRCRISYTWLFLLEEFFWTILIFEKLFIIHFCLFVYDLYNSKILLALVSFIFLLVISLPQFRTKGQRSLESNTGDRTGVPGCSRILQDTPWLTRTCHDAPGHTSPILYIALEVHMVFNTCHFSVSTASMEHHCIPSVCKALLEWSPNCPCECKFTAV